MATDNVQHNAAWLREQRARLGWSAEEIAERARLKAREYGDSIKLSQQLVSKFENGKLKSTPRWLGYVQMAVGHYLAANDLPAGTVHAANLPRELKEYIQDRVHAYNTRLDWDDDNDLSIEERGCIEKLRRLSPKDRAAVLQLLDTLANCGESEPPPTLHDTKLEYRAAQ